MGRKTNPIGLRVGLHRKWIGSWYGSVKNKAYYNTTFTNQTFLPQGNLSLRGNLYFSGIENILINLFKRYFFTKLSKTIQFIPVDFRFFKGNGGHVYAFLLYIKRKSKGEAKLKV